MKSKLPLLLFSILLISSISALDYTIQLNDEDVTHAVIFNTYKIYLNGDLSGNLTNNYPDTLTLLEDYGTIRIYEWTINSQAGKRTFQIGEDTFTFPVISEVDEMLNKITNFKIFVGENDSYIETNFDLFGTTQEMQFIEYQGYSANINFANLLKGLNGNVELNEGEFYPTINSLVINSSTAITVVEALFMEEGHPFTVDDFNSDPQYYINYLIDYYNLTYEYPLTIQVIKNNNYYKLSAEEGYSSISGDLETQVQDFINSKLEYFTPLDIVDEIFKFTDYDLSDYFDLDYDYELAIDFNNLVLEDGIYTLSFLYEDAHRNTGEKNFNVILDITEEVIIEPEPECTSGQTTCDGEYYLVCVNNAWINYGQTDGYCGYEAPEPEENETTYIPSNIEVLQYVNKISGLEQGTQVEIEILENPNVPELTNTETFGYLNITANQTTSGNIFFSLLKTQVTDSSKVSLYVLENNTWTKLDTSLVSITNLYYNYKAITPHFSIFLIAEEITTTTLSSGGSSCKTTWECSEWSTCINELQIRECEKVKSWCKTTELKPEESRKCIVSGEETGKAQEPIEISDSETEEEQGFFARITGATIGALGGQEKIFLGIVILIFGAMLIFILIKNKKRKEKIKAEIKEKQKESEVEETKEDKEKIKVEEAEKKKTPKTRSESKKNQKKKPNAKTKTKKKLKEESKEKIDIKTESITSKIKKQAKKKPNEKAKSKGKKKSKKKPQAKSKSS